MDRLPNELVSLIARALVQGPPLVRTDLNRPSRKLQAEHNVAQLEPFSLVDRRIRALCEPLLFEHIDWHQGGRQDRHACPPRRLLRHCRLFTFASDESSESLTVFAAYVALYARNLEAVRAVNGPATAFMQHLVEACSQGGRRILALEYVNVPSWPRGWPVLLFRGDLPHLSSLGHRGLDLSSKDDWRWVVASPESLVLDRPRQPLRLVQVDPLDGTARLRRLAIANSRETFPLPLTNGLFRLVGRPLVTLSLESVAVNERWDLGPEAANLLPSLRFLEIRFVSRSTANALLDAFSPSRSIESLFVDAIGPVPFPSPNRALEGICPDPAQLASCLRGGGFPSLKTLRVRYDAAGPEERLETLPLTEAGLRSLKAVSATRAVRYELRMFRDGLVEMTERDF